jgi:hypothetical protein
LIEIYRILITQNRVKRESLELDRDYDLWGRFGGTFNVWQVQSAICLLPDVRDH